MVEYISKAFLVGFIAFLPVLEIYTAVPIGIGMGLDYFSTVVFSVIGNYAPVLLLNFGYERLNRIPKVQEWFAKLSSQRLKNWIDSYGIGFIVLGVPLIGVWPLTVTMKLFRMNSGLFLIYSFISVVLYSVAIAGIVHTGSDWLHIGK
ncbi:small multi-drug export protein [Nostoc sp. CHAB 5715]|uniref:small multi-drug export protein n=1 Tax=Nostoc sp. CHAB 5715 TaxID=2780400 RepID=UPI001E2E26AC|nr:small multi-drug export protein [Nostoc sp. CHAB 5715]MCC5620158.1 small multi-drug export protein [Nostoc sp. CHAB 5715]